MHRVEEPETSLRDKGSIVNMKIRQPCSRICHDFSWKLQIDISVLRKAYLVKMLSLLVNATFLNIEFYQDFSQINCVASNLENRSHIHR